MAVYIWVILTGVGVFIFTVFKVLSSQQVVYNSRKVFFRQDNYYNVFIMSKLVV